MTVRATEGDRNFSVGPCVYGTVVAILPIRRSNCLTHLNSIAMKKLPYFLSILFLFTLFFGAPAQAQTQPKKKVSPQAKGAIIGAGSGAILGGVIHKRNRVVGGVVGGVAGAGAGYAIGKHIDNKNKEKAAAAEAAAAAERAAAYRAQAAANNSSSVATVRRTSSPARSTSRTRTVAPMALAASSPEASVTAEGYLPNTDFGDPANPYANSEYRRRSW